jgi:hypothetical protein
MMTHLTEEQLIAYRIGEADGREGIATHLNECAACRQELAQIDAVFAALDTVPIPDPHQDFPDRMWRQISPRLPAKRPRWWQTLVAPRRVLAFATVGVLLLLAFFLGRFTRPNAPAGTIADAGKIRQRVLVVAVGNHLGRTEMVLMQLANTVPERGQERMNISGEQKRAEDLVQENRLYRDTALRDGDRMMADTLDELEPILLDIANSPDEITPEQFEAIQKRIAAKGILLKVRIATQELRQQEANPAKEAQPGDESSAERNET